MRQSKQNDFAMVLLPQQHVPLSPLIFSCCAAYHLESTTEFSHLQGFWLSLATGSPLCSTLRLVPHRLNCMWEVGCADRVPPGSKNCVCPCNFLSYLPSFSQAAFQPFLLLSHSRLSAVPAPQPFPPPTARGSSGRAALAPPRCRRGPAPEAQPSGRRPGSVAAAAERARSWSTSAPPRYARCCGTGEGRQGS